MKTIDLGKLLIFTAVLHSTFCNVMNSNSFSTNDTNAGSTQSPNRQPFGNVTFQNATSSCGQTNFFATAEINSADLRFDPNNPNDTCIYSFYSSNGSGLELNLIVPEQDCIYQFDIFEGNVLLGQLNCNNSVAAISSRSHTISVHTKAQNFILLTASYEEGNLSCGDVIFATSSPQHLSTFGLSETNALNCLWLIKPTSGSAEVELRIENFNTRPGNGFINVYAGVNLVGVVYPIPESYFTFKTSFHDGLRLRYTTNGGGNYGFNATFLQITTDFIPNFSTTEVSSSIATITTAPETNPNSPTKMSNDSLTSYTNVSAQTLMSVTRTQSSSIQEQVSSPATEIPASTLTSKPTFTVNPVEPITQSSHTINPNTPESAETEFISAVTKTAVNVSTSMLPESTSNFQLGSLTVETINNAVTTDTTPTSLKPNIPFTLATASTTANEPTFTPSELTSSIEQSSQTNGTITNVVTSKTETSRPTIDPNIETASTTTTANELTSIPSESTFDTKQSFSTLETINNTVTIETASNSSKLDSTTLFTTSPLILITESVTSFLSTGSLSSLGLISSPSKITSMATPTTNNSEFFTNGSSANETFLEDVSTSSTVGSDSTHAVLTKFPLIQGTPTTESANINLTVDILPGSNDSASLQLSNDSSTPDHGTSTHTLLSVTFTESNSSISTTTVASSLAQNPTSTPALTESITQTVPTISTQESIATTSPPILTRDSSVEFSSTNPIQELTNEIASSTSSPESTTKTVSRTLNPALTAENDSTFFSSERPSTAEASSLLLNPSDSPTITTNTDDFSSTSLGHTIFTAPFEPNSASDSIATSFPVTTTTESATLKTTIAPSTENISNGSRLNTTVTSTQSETSMLLTVTVTSKTANDGSRVNNTKASTQNEMPVTATPINLIKTSTSEQTTQVTPNSAETSRATTSNASTPQTNTATESNRNETLPTSVNATTNFKPKSTPLFETSTLPLEKTTNASNTTEPTTAVGSISTTTTTQSSTTQAVQSPATIITSTTSTNETNFSPQMLPSTILSFILPLLIMQISLLYFK